MLLTDNGEPESYDEVKQVSESGKWEHAMQEEMDSLHSNGTWDLARLSAGKKLCITSGRIRSSTKVMVVRDTKPDWL